MPVAIGKDQRSGPHRREFGQERHGPAPWQIRIDRETAEGCLAHVIGNAVERAYRRGDDLKQRRVALDAWATYLDTAP